MNSHSRPGTVNGHYAHGACVGGATKEYAVWSAMIQRCTNPKNKNFKDYGGRGIEVCARWMGFESFIADMGKCPEGYMLERMDNSKGYSPSNCKWSSRVEQANNRRNNRIIEFNGEAKTVVQWEKHFGLKKNLLFQRLNAGWDFYKAVSTPSMRA